MKNRKKLALIGLMAIIAIFGITACDNGGGSGGDPALSGTITISPNTGVETGTELTATYSGTETVSYQWKKDGSNVGTDSNKYLPTEAGSYTVTVSATGYTSKTSTAVSVTVGFVDGQPSLGAIGPGGGKIFYHSAEGFTVYQNATDTEGITCHYLESAPENMATRLAWASSEFYNTNITGTAYAIGTGRKNTAIILATDADAPAAKACNEYTNNGKSDWFLPSFEELNQLYVNRTHVGNLKTTEDYNHTDLYLSSSQDGNNYAFGQNFTNNGYRTTPTKDNTSYSVRAVRAF